MTTAPPRPDTPAHTSPRITSGELAATLGASLLGPADVTLTRMDSLDHAAPGALVFIRNHRFARRWPASQASAALISRSIALADLIPDFDPANPASPRPLLIVPDADMAAIRAAAFFTPPAPPAPPGIHPGAHVDPAASVHPTASIGPGCILRAGCVVGERAVLVAGVVLGLDARVGADTVLHPHVCVLDRCVVGERCILHAGVIIGADGFGYRPSAQGLVKVPQIGNVILENDIEIGANSCVDRATFGSTFVGSGTKIDNLVQIGHNCRIGRSCVICGHVALAGSVVLGDAVMLGGKVGVADGVEIGDRAKVAAYAGVATDLAPNGSYMGAPAGPASEWRRTLVALRRFSKRTGDTDR
ncbi:MAG: UDP-3-O-(3-hydroxymyristoyl)glucosamine N-acyltransferase [Planctomycetota bacterium]|nr:UDP-3-O-(3-hydroxymyristoyl)glucosamine N-acyltransferase [Planctomycetota bacterium]